VTHCCCWCRQGTALAGGGCPSGPLQKAAATAVRQAAADCAWLLHGSCCLQVRAGMPEAHVPGCNVCGALEHQSHRCCSLLVGEVCHLAALCCRCMPMVEVSRELYVAWDSATGRVHAAVANAEQCSDWNACARSWTCEMVQAGIQTSRTTFATASECCVCGFLATVNTASPQGTGP
jgi:hypothetical protein